MNAAAGYYSPGLAHFDEDWVGPVLGEHAQEPGRHSRRVAATLLRRHYGLDERHTAPTPNCADWLMYTPERQRALALDLGAAANAAHLRHLIDAQQVSEVIETLGHDTYVRALRGTVLAVTGVSAQDLYAAIAERTVRNYLGAIGVALLGLSVSSDDHFAQLRMRFSFPRAWWDARPTHLHVDLSQLKQVLNEHG